MAKLHFRGIEKAKYWYFYQLLINISNWEDLNIDGKTKRFLSQKYFSVRTTEYYSEWEEEKLQYWRRRRSVSKRRRSFGDGAFLSWLLSRRQFQVISGMLQTSDRSFIDEKLWLCMKPNMNDNDPIFFGFLKHYFCLLLFGVVWYQYVVVWYQYDINLVWYNMIFNLWI